MQRSIGLITLNAKFIHSSLALEALVQLPIYQTENSNIMSQKMRLILGVKYMF